MVWDGCIFTVGGESLKHAVDVLILLGVIIDFVGFGLLLTLVGSLFTVALPELTTVGQRMPAVLACGLGGSQLQDTFHACVWAQ